MSRSWLYCPANRPDRACKAMKSDADVVVLDLEDAVPAHEKDLARKNLGEIVAGADGKPTWLRINALDTEWGEADLDALYDLPVDGVRLPKCESAESVTRVGDRAGKPMTLLIETALGVERAFELAAAHPLVASIMLGEADLTSALRSEDLSWVRNRIVVASHAAGLGPPVQSVYTSTSDADGLRATSVAGRRLGFYGRSVIHPSQIAIVNEVFTPSRDELARAREVVALLDAAAEAGDGAVLSDDGTLVDAAKGRHLRRLLRQADTKRN